jgi:hypothetical protein
VGLPDEYPAKRYQTHTFIKDGNLNIPNAEFVLETATYNSVILRGVPHTVLDKQKGRMIIHFEKMPVINEQMMEDATIGLTALADKTKDALVQEALQKVVKDQIKVVKEAMGVEAEMSEDFATLNEDQIQVLLDHGVDRRSTYSGISKERAERTDDSDYYMVASVQKKIDEKKKLTPREEPIGQALKRVGEVLKVCDHDGQTEKEKMIVLENMLNRSKSGLLHHRSEMAQFKIAMVLNADFEALAGLDFDEKTKTAEFQGVCLKMDRVRQYI